MLYVPAEQVPETIVQMKVSDGELSTKQVFGQHSSLMIASRSSGYHSLPHRHACEQINYVQAGEVWVFIEDTAYHLRVGDFLRIPPRAVHWAWNRSTEPCELIEVHSPGLLLPGHEDAPVLLAENEGILSSKVPNEWVDTSYWQREEAALATHGVTL